jgi:hypothetical protein
MCPVLSIGVFRVVETRHRARGDLAQTHADDSAADNKPTTALCAVPDTTCHSLEDKNS